MENQDNSMKLLVFHGMSKDDVEQNWFTYDTIYSVKTIIDEAAKIMQLKTILRDISVMWYMEYKATMPVG
jgi:hypothetical protein